MKSRLLSVCKVGWHFTIGGVRYTRFLLLQASQNLNDFAKGITNLGTALNGSLASTNDAVTAEMQGLADEIMDWMAESLVLQPLAELPAAGKTVDTTWVD